MLQERNLDWLLLTVITDNGFDDDGDDDDDDVDDDDGDDDLAKNNR